MSGFWFTECQFCEHQNVIAKCLWHLSKPEVIDGFCKSYDGPYKPISMVQDLESQLSALQQQLADEQAKREQAEAQINETHTDENGTVWTRPTAWAYMAVCKANDKNREAKEQAEAWNKTMDETVTKWKNRAEQAEAQAAVISKMACGLCRTCFPEDSQECSITDCPVKLGTAGAELLARINKMKDALQVIVGYVKHDAPIPPEANSLLDAISNEAQEALK